MEKKFVKLNDSFSHLSIGNIINVIKDEARNKTSAIQSEVFSSLFNIDYINESTVNNYCIGARAIGNDYKQIYITLKKKYETDHDLFIPIIKNVLSIVTGSIYDISDINKINKNEYLINMSNKLFNIAKNDFYVPSDFIKTLKSYLDNKLYYDFFVNVLFYAILEKTQPLYESDKVKNVINTILQNTEISAKELQDFLLLELNEGINFSYSINNLAKKGNSFAYFQIATEYYRGEITGDADYINSYKYLCLAAKHNHPSSYWMIANMIIKGKLGPITKEMTEEALENLHISESLGNIAAINSLGLCYKTGFGVPKDEKTALKYFERAAKSNYAYAFNNIAEYYKDTDYNKYIENYKKSADLGESYACNKIGLYYLDNRNYSEAYKYFNNALECTLRAKCMWAYYNLAKYFYSTGKKEIFITPDLDKAIKYYELSSTDIIESLIELLNIYVIKYLNNHTEIYNDLINKTVKRIENHKDYTNKHKLIIENNLKQIKEYKINLDMLKIDE